MLTSEKLPLLPEKSDNPWLEYMFSRGYYPRGPVFDPSVLHLRKGETREIDGKLIVEAQEDEIGWICRSPSGELIGVQTRPLAEKKYRWHPNPKAYYLPIIYAQEEDHEILFKTRKMVIAEGPFDRQAIKRCLPEYAVYGRLSKGAANQLMIFIKRYATCLILAFDNDEPGLKATETTKARFADLTSIDVLELKLPSKDPSKMLETRGITKMSEMLRKQLASQEF